MIKIKRRCMLLTAITMAHDQKKDGMHKTKRSVFLL